jgi:hypothetical protein
MYKRPLIYTDVHACQECMRTEREGASTGPSGFNVQENKCTAEKEMQNKIKRDNNKSCNLKTIFLILIKGPFWKWIWSKKTYVQLSFSFHIYGIASSKPDKWHTVV